MPDGLVQRNVYKGSPSRCWVSLRFEALDGSIHEREFLADTGCPCAVIFGQNDFAQLLRTETKGIDTNFGKLTGGQFLLASPELELVGAIQGFGSEEVFTATQESSATFAGLVGLPLLRRLAYGGDAEAFWVRRLSE